MPTPNLELRWFKATFTTIGVIYVLLASSMLVRGVIVLRDFEVPESVVASPVVADLFSFFYELMAVVGGLMILFGQVTKGLRAQLLVSRAFCGLSLLGTLRDLSTSDTRFGSHIYKGDRTILFVVLGLAFALAFGLCSLSTRRPAPP